MISIPEFLTTAPRHLFFIGKGGVRKTSLACGKCCPAGQVPQANKALWSDIQLAATLQSTTSNAQTAGL
jgi:anion-transporting  ArsA/GET3 family ATPase